MEKELRALLRSSAAIAAYCGEPGNIIEPTDFDQYFFASGARSNRVNFSVHPEGVALPALVLNVVSEAEGFNLDGPDGLASSLVQIDCYAGSYGEAKDLSHAVRGVLSGHSGGVIQGVFFGTARDGRETDAKGVALYRVSMDFSVLYSR